MDKLPELRTLQARAVAIAAVKDVDKRHHGGMKLELDCRAFEDKYKTIGGFDSQTEVELRAVVSILFDHILYDAFEDKDWSAAVNAPEVNLDDVVRGIDES